MTEPTPKNPLGPTGSTTARRVRELREASNWTYEELARRLRDEAKRPIPSLGLRRIEAQARRVDADDLVALAYVLKVNPSALLLPPTNEGDVEVTGAGVVPAVRAWNWMDGRAQLHQVDDDGSADIEFQLRARPHGRRHIRAATDPGRAALADELEAMGAVVERDDQGRIVAVRASDGQD